MDLFLDKTLSSISFISSAPPRKFGVKSFDPMTFPDEEEASSLPQTRIFVQSFTYHNNNNNTKNNQTDHHELFACGGRVLTGEMFLNLLHNSCPQDVFVFSGVCKLSPPLDTNHESVTDDDDEELFSKFTSSLKKSVQHSRPSSAASTNTFFNSTHNFSSSASSSSSSSYENVINSSIPTDAYLWFSPSLDEPDGRWVSGKEIAMALQNARNFSAGGKGGGTLFLNCDYACFVAQNQYSSAACGSAFERLTNTLATVMTSAIGSKNEQNFTNSKTKSVLELLSRYTIVEETVDDLFRSEYALQLFDSTNTSSSPLTKLCPQLPLNVIPLSCGKILCSKNDEHANRDDQREKVHDSIIERLLHSFPDLEEFHSNVNIRIDHDHHHRPVIWTKSMFLTRIFPDDETHQKFMLNLLTSPSWQQMLGVMKNMETLEDAKNYIQSRPDKMFRERGIGSFAIVVPIEKELSRNEYLFRESNKNSSSQKNNSIPTWCSSSSSESNICGNNNNEDFIASSSWSPTIKVTEYIIVGMAGFIKRPEMEGDYDLGFALLPEFQGRGYAAIASNLVLAYAKRAMGLHRVRAVTAEKNEASLRLLEKRLGFTKMFEGKTNSFSWGVPNFVLEKEL